MQASGQSKQTVLVTGATGYIGGRLYKRLADEGYRVRCMGRRPEELAKRVGPDIEAVFGDVQDRESLESALDGVDTAYYLVHALAATGDFEQVEITGAMNFAAAAERCGVKRIIYLGGLAEDEDEMSAHMRSRHAVGEILRNSTVPTLEFRAAVVIGAGSISFDLIRSLVRRLPIMLVPKWVRVKTQPIAVDDILDYLTQAITVDLQDSTIYEVGGAERLSYLDLMKRYGEAAGLRRVYINVPVLTPYLSSLWLNLVTPIFARIGRKLIDSISMASIVRDDRALHDFTVRPMNVTEAIAHAIADEDRSFIETHWSDALSTSETRRYGGERFGSRIVDSRVLKVRASRETAFQVIERIGGTTGWYYGDWLWQLRGLLDTLTGGVGMRRGRRDPETLQPGDVVDCWRVEKIERPNCLLLRAEMKVFGRAWLQFEVDETDPGVEIRQTAIYDPHGLLGLIYWYLLYPLHEFVFGGMLRNIVRCAENDTEGRRGQYARRTKPRLDTLPKR